MPVSMMKRCSLGLLTLSFYVAGLAGHAAACDRSAVLRQVISGVAAPAAKPSAARSAMALSMAQSSISRNSNGREHNGPPSIVGLWNVTFYVDGQPAGESFDAWNLGGTEILTDNTNPIEDNVCIGTWQQTGRRTFKLYHPSYFFDDSGALQGTAILRDTAVLSHDGNSYSGDETVDVYDPAGNFLGHFTDSFTAKRLTVDF